MNILAHNTTTIRSLAEIRHREDTPAIATQYQASETMAMRPVSPNPVSSEEVLKVISDIKEIKKPKAVSGTGRINEKSKSKSPAVPVQIPKIPAPWNPLTNFVAEEQTVPGPATEVLPCCTPSGPEAAGPVVPPSTLLELKAAVKEPAEDSIKEQPTTPAKVAAAGQLEKDEQQQVHAGQAHAQSTPNIIKTGDSEAENARRKFSNIFKKTKKSKDQELTENIKATASSMAKLSADTFKAARDLQSFQENIPQIRVGEVPITNDDKEEAIKPYRTALETGGSDPLALLMATGSIGALGDITELPLARTHSLSDDFLVTTKPRYERLHSISTDSLVPSGKTTASHILAHDKTINRKPAARSAHRLSTDDMIPIRTTAPGHYLDADPTVTASQQLFPHELLQDTTVQRQISPLPHDLDADKKLITVQKPLQTHGLENDTVISGQNISKQHTLHSDPIITSGASSRVGHDISHDVRILSPSGKVRDPHSLDEDTVIKETAVFRKSPHPDAMPGHWAGTSSSGEVNENPMASLNASLHSVGQALDELKRTLESSSVRENETADLSTAGQGFWGRMFGRREGPEEGEPPNNADANEGHRMQEEHRGSTR